MIDNIGNLDWWFEYKESPLKYIVISLLYVFVAIFIAVIINLISKSIQIIFQLSPTFTVLIHLIIMTTVLYIIEMHLLKRFTAKWLSTTPGFLFTGFFIAFQPTLLKNVPYLIKNVAQYVGL